MRLIDARIENRDGLARTGVSAVPGGRRADKRRALGESRDSQAVFLDGSDFAGVDECFQLHRIDFQSHEGNGFKLLYLVGFILGQGQFSQHLRLLPGNLIALLRRDGGYHQPFRSEGGTHPDDDPRRAIHGRLLAQRADGLGGIRLGACRKRDARIISKEGAFCGGRRRCGKSG